MGGNWVTRSVKVKDYGWSVDMRDATLRELTELREAKSDMNKVLAVLANLITGWDVTTPNGQQMTVSDGALMDVPNQMIVELLGTVFERVAGGGSGAGNPKGGSDSTPTTPVRPEEATPAERQ